MKKITKHHLDFETELNYELIGICSTAADYRLVWSINEAFDVRFEKADDSFEVTQKKGVVVSFPYYSTKNEEERWELYLIKNKHEGKSLIPEKAQIDYFLFFCNDLIHSTESWVDKLRDLNTIMSAYIFDPNTLNSTQNIIFE